MDDMNVGHNFERRLFKDYPIKVWFNLAEELQRWYSNAFLSKSAKFVCLFVWCHFQQAKFVYFHQYSLISKEQYLLSKSSNICHTTH